MSLVATMSFLYWEWVASSSETRSIVRGTHIWPELIALMGLLLIVASIYSQHRVSSLLSSPLKLEGAQILKLLGLFALTPIAIAPGVWLLFDELKLFDLVLTQVVEFHLAFGLVALYLVKRSTQMRLWSVLLVVLYLGVLVVCGVHTLQLCRFTWPRVDVDGVAYQHVGLDQQIMSSIRRGNEWTLDRSKAFVSGQELGVQDVEFTAQSGFEYQRHTIHVDVGVETSGRDMPLAERNSWTYRRTSNVAHLEDLETTFTIHDRRTDGPLHTLELTNFQDRLFAHNGKVYVLRETNRASPLIGSKAPYEFNLFEDVRCRCQVKAVPISRDLEISGPTNCSGRRTTAVHGLAIALSVGLAALDPNFGDAVQYELIRSRKIADPMFVIPAQ